MDCRKTLGWSLCLLAGAAGCSHQVTTMPAVPPVQAYAPPAVVQNVPPDAVVKREADLPARTPQAKTCTAGGDYFAKEAAAPNLGETERKSQQEQARRLYVQALTIDPHYLPAYLALADLYLGMKDHAHAVATYRQAAQLFPNDARVFFALGKCYGGQQEWGLAVHALGRACELEPENRQFADTLGWMQAREGRYEDSLTTFMRVHDEAEAHYNLALMLEHLQQIDLCKEHLLAALTKEPRLDAARALLSKLQAPPAAPVQTASFTESAKPVLTDAVPAPTPTPTEPVKPVLTDVVPGPSDEPPVMPRKPALAPASVPVPTPTAKGVLLPPPPRIPLSYEAAPAVPPAPDAVPTDVPALPKGASR